MLDRWCDDYATKEELSGRLGFDFRSFISFGVSPWFSCGLQDGTSAGLWAEAKERVGLLSRASSGAFAAKNPTVNSRAFRISAMASSLRAKGQVAGS